MTTQRLRSALVTGSSGGLGLAVAESLAAAGFNIILQGLRRPPPCDRRRCATASVPNLLSPPQASCFVLGNVFAHHALVSL